MGTINRGRRAWPGALGVVLLLPALVLAGPVDEMLREYRGAGSTDFSAARGEALWRRSVEGRSCTQCHGESPTLEGRHQRTGKPIEPMAPSVNPQRLTDRAQIDKWFLRNCKWTLGRECTVQERGDFLTWLRHQ